METLKVEDAEAVSASQRFHRLEEIILFVMSRLYDVSCGLTHILSRSFLRLTPTCKSTLGLSRR